MKENLIESDQITPAPNSEETNSPKGIKNVLISESKVLFRSLNLGNISLAGLFLFITCPVYSFSSFGTTFLTSRWMIPSERAGTATSLIGLVDAFCPPLLGLLVGWVGKRTYFVRFFSLCLMYFVGYFWSIVVICGIYCVCKCGLLGS